MDTVVIVSPYNASTASQRTRNLDYARRAAWDALSLGEAPIAIHLVLGDPSEEETPEMRSKALTASETIIRKSDRVAVYTDFGISDGMEYEMRVARYLGKSITRRILPLDQIQDLNQQER